MRRAGNDIEVIKRRGRWKSSSPHMFTNGNKYQFAAHGEANSDQWITNSGRAGGKESQCRQRQSIDYLIHNPRGRMRAISKDMSKELRTENIPDRQKDGFIPLETLPDTQSVRELFATQTDIRGYVLGRGGVVTFDFDRESCRIRRRLQFVHNKDTFHSRLRQMIYYQYRETWSLLRMAQHCARDTLSFVQVYLRLVVYIFPCTRAIWKDVRRCARRVRNCRRK